MPKNYCMTEAEKKASMAKSVEKYKSKIKNDEIFCDACRIPVKRLSIFNHNKGKKHIENYKEFTKDYREEMLELFEKFKNSNDIQDISTQIYYLIQEQYFDAEGTEKVLDKDLKHDAKTQEEIAFCSQPVGSMSYDIEILIEEEVHDHKLYDSVKEQRDKIDINSINAKQKLLDIWRRIKSTEEKPIPAIVAKPLPPKHIKTIEEPKVVKKVEIKEQLLEEDFPELHLFEKASSSAKYHTLSFIKDSHLYIFDNNEYVLKELEESLEENIEENYDELYYVILGLKKEYDINERRNKSRINLDDSEEEEEEEEDF